MQEEVYASNKNSDPSLLYPTGDTDLPEKGQSIPCWAHDLYLAERYVLESNEPGLNKLLAAEHGSHRSEALQAAIGIARGEYQRVLQSCRFFSFSSKCEYSSLATFQDELCKTANAFIEHGNLVGDSFDEYKAWKFAELLWVGVASLLLFLQLNYTGPELDVEQINSTSQFFMDYTSLSNSSANVLLCADGEMPYPRSSLPAALVFTRALLKTIHASISNHLSTLKWWEARCCVAHARLLLFPERSPILWSETENCFRDVIHRFGGVNDGYCNAGSCLAVMAWQELGLAEHYFERTSKGKHCFEHAREVSGLKIRVSGAMGKRTKYQDRELAQIVLIAESATNSNSHQRTGTKSNATIDPIEDKQDSSMQIPYTLQKVEVHDNDSHLLEQVSFSENALERPADLLEVDLCTILGLCLDVSNSNPRDGLTNEQMSPYIDRILRTPNNWMIYSTALLQRAWIEFERHHLAERSALQLQALLDQHTTRLSITQASVESIESSAKVQERMAWLHSLTYPPQWELKKDLAQRYAKLGIFKSAAEMFAELELWDEAVECYSAMQLTGTAEAIIQERLKIDPTPRMWCALGDIKQDPQYFENAWELSNKQLAKAQTGLARIYMNKGDYEVAVNHFKQAVSVKPSLPRAWFTMGALLMRLERWSEALTAFSQVVMQCPEDGEAWGNCAAIHLHLGAWDQADAALSQALKYNRTNWRLWDNKITAVLHLKHWDEAIYAMHKLLDMQSQHQRPVDVSALSVLAQAAVDSINGMDAGVNNQSSLVKSVAELLGRVSSSVKCPAGVWDIYAVFNESLGRGADKVADCRAKQCRALLAKSGWEKQEESIDAVADASQELVNAHLALGTKTAKYQAKMHVKTCCKKIEVGVDRVGCAGHLRLKHLLQTLEPE